VRYFSFFIFRTAFFIHFLFVILFSVILFLFVLFLTAINFLMFVLVRKRLLLVFDRCFDVQVRGTPWILHSSVLISL
jgi:hypothetical protein